MTRVSVVIPAYNHAQYIGAAIKSIYEGNFRNFEIVVVDDGSSDSTYLEVSKFPEVKYVYQDNSGAHAAINAGIANASYKYIAILNDDDLYLPDHLENAINNINRFGNDLFIGSPQIIGTGPKYAALSKHVKASTIAIEEYGYKYSLLKVNWSLSTSAFVFKKSLFTDLGGFSEYKMCHDLDFLLRAIFEKEINWGVSIQPTWQYRCHESNSGSSIKLIHQQIEIALCALQVIKKCNRGNSSLDLKTILDYGLPKDLVDLVDSNLISAGNTLLPPRVQNFVSRLLPELTRRYAIQSKMQEA